MYIRPNSVFGTLAVVLSLATGVKSTSSTLLWGGTIVAFDDTTESLNVIRGGSILVTDDRIAGVYDEEDPADLPDDTEKIDTRGQIITPGFIDTHRHGWQTAFKTIASNTSLVEYFGRYSEFVAGPGYTPRDVYLGQLAGLYEAINGGVTTLLDHAHHTWSNETAYAGLNASIDSNARVFWAYVFHNISEEYTVADQIPNFREIAESGLLEDSPTELGLAFDAWTSSPNVAENQYIADLALEYNVSVLTLHALGGPWGYDNQPSLLHNTYGILNTSIPVVISHASFLSASDAELLRSTNQYISITPESEMHYGHGHPNSHLIQDQAALGVDTHFTYSADILTQARIWLQSVRLDLYNRVLNTWSVPGRNPMSVNQAFLLATRAGGLALRRTDLGVIQQGAKADLVIWNAKDSPSLIGWVDPVAAVILHASVGDVLHVLIDGKFVKRDGRLVDPNYDAVREEFQESAKKIQETWLNTPQPPLDGEYQSGFPIRDPDTADTLRGDGTGYGELYLE